MLTTKAHMAHMAQLENINHYYSETSLSPVLVNIPV